MADQMIRDVDDALRADKMHQWWQQNKRAVIAFCVALILGTAANSVWQRQREAKGGHMLAMLSENQQLLASDKAQQAADGFKAIAAEASGEFKDLALVWESRALLASGKKDEAVEPLKEAVSDTSSGLWADIACLRLAGLDANAAAPCLSSKNTSPLASTRAEWAAANQWAAGDTNGAISAIQKQLANKDLTTDSRERLTQWLAVMQTEKGSTAKAMPADAKTTANTVAKDDVNDDVRENTVSEKE